MIRPDVGDICVHAMGDISANWQIVSDPAAIDEQIRALQAAKQWLIAKQKREKAAKK